MQKPEFPKWPKYSEWASVSSKQSVKQFFKLRTKPRFPDEALRKKLKFSVLYFIGTFILLNMIVGQNISFSAKPDPDEGLRKARIHGEKKVDIYTFENFRFKKYQNFAPEDFDKINPRN